MQKVELIPEHTCWEWIAASDGNGYGYFKFNGKMTGAHRVSHILFKGPISKNMDVMHSCDNRKCVNPMHLSMGTRKQNMKDCVSKARNENAKQKRNKTHCKRGHIYDEENTAWRFSFFGRAHRECRSCKRINCLRFREKNHSFRVGSEY